MDSFEEKLFKKFQKDKWEIKTLGEITEKIYRKDDTITHTYKYPGDYPALTGKTVFESSMYIENCEIFVDSTTIKKPKYIEKGDLVMLVDGFSNLGKTSLYLGEEKCLLGNSLTLIKHNQNPKYLINALTTRYVKEQIKSIIKKGVVSHIYVEDINKLKIPLPPLEIQNQIANFLDKFMSLNGEMKKEMKKRMEQYQHYKELVFNRGIKESNWEIKSLGEIITSHHGGNDITKKHLGTGSFPAITNLDLFNSKLFIKECVSFVDENLIYNKKYVEEGDLIISDRSNVKDKVGQASVYLGKEKCLVERRTLIIKHNQNPKYLSYALSTSFTRKQVEEMMYVGIFSGILGSNIKKLKIPLPPLEEQERIVKQLDKLYEIAHDMNNGIPKMIELSQKQYEYYKEKLLNL